MAERKNRFFYSEKGKVKDQHFDLICSTIGPISKKLNGWNAGEVRISYVQKIKISF